MFGIKKREVVSLQINEKECIGCESCVRRCRRKVLDMVYTDIRVYASAIYPYDCTGCGKCVRVCQVGAVKLVTN